MSRTPEDFGAAFTALLAAAGLSVDGVLRHQPGAISRSALYDWKRGRHLPEDSGPMLAVVELCLERVRARGAESGAAPGDAEGWLSLLAEAKQNRDSRAAREGSRAWARPSGEGAAAGTGRLISRWDPVVLGVHRAIGGGPLPGYVRRPHDDLLYAVLDPAVAANRLVVLRGDSATGKSRAAYQAVMARLPRWPVLYPRTAAALAAMLHQGVPRRSVLWLNELRHYADDSAAVLFELADLLQGRDHVVAITTLWPAYWAAFTAAHAGEPGTIDSTRASRELLTPLPELTGRDPGRVHAARGGVIDVPAAFGEHQLAQVRRRGDAVLEEAIIAAERAGQPGRLAQYLAGVPDLLAHYQRPGAGPYGQALITAAMDAVRLGHAQPLGEDLLWHAAIGYLAPERRAIEGEEAASRQDQAWAYATQILKGAVRALRPVPPEFALGVAGYRLADSLEQHGRDRRAEAVPPPAFWNAVAAYAHPADLRALADAARRRGRYRDAALLLKRATAHGVPYAASALISLMRATHPADHRPATWAATEAPLGSAEAVNALLDKLREVGADDQVRILLRRDPAAEVSLHHAGPVCRLLDSLGKVGADDQVITLATRAAPEVPLDHPSVVSRLLDRLQKAGADDQIRALLRRDSAAAVSLNDLSSVSSLLYGLRRVGADDQVISLANRAATEAPLDDPAAVHYLLDSLRRADADDQVRALLRRDPAAGVSLDHRPETVGRLLGSLREVGADDQFTDLADRAVAHALDHPAAAGPLLDVLRRAGAHEQLARLADGAVARAPLDDPTTVSWLLHRLWQTGLHEQAHTVIRRTPAILQVPLHGDVEKWLLDGLRKAGPHDPFSALAGRAVAEAPLDDPIAVSWLLDKLHLAGAGDQIRALLGRDLAAAVSLDDLYAVCLLLHRLRWIGEDDLVIRLATRAAAEAPLDNPRTVTSLLARLGEAGAHDQFTTLAARMPAAGLFDEFRRIDDHRERFRFGCEGDGSPSAAWTWDDLD